MTKHVKQLTDYPTWVKTADGWISLEQRNDVPDFQIVRQASKDWRLKWRTSARWQEFPSAKAAKDSVEVAVRAQDGMQRAPSAGKSRRAV